MKKKPTKKSKTHEKSASHPPSETQTKNVNHFPYETHPENVNHTISETHPENVNHTISETHPENVNHTISETHPENVNHTISETHPENVNHTISETHPENVNHPISETHSIGVNQSGSETQSDLVSLEGISGEKLADLNSAKTAVGCYYDLQKPRVSLALRMSARQRLKEDGKLPNGELPIDVKLKNAYEYLDKAEKELGKALVYEAEKRKVWKFWLSKVKGIGPVLGACFIGLVDDATKFSTVSKLWAYSGQAVVEGHAQRKTAGEKINWNPLLKVTCWKAANSFIKFDCFYRGMYDRFKAEDLAKHPEPIQLLSKDGSPRFIKGTKKPYCAFSKNHIHKRALRKTAKLFLSHLWQAWYDAEGVKAPSEPYAFSQLKHTDLIPYSRACEKEEKKT